jgi:hypothetical protein
MSYTVIGDTVFINGQLGTINCSGCSGVLNITMPFTTKTTAERSDFYYLIGYSGVTTIQYFIILQAGGGSAGFQVNAKMADGTINNTVATLLASAGSFDLNIVGGTYKRA